MYEQTLCNGALSSIVEVTADVSFPTDRDTVIEGNRYARIARTAATECAHTRDMDGDDPDVYERRVACATLALEAAMRFLEWWDGVTTSQRVAAGF